MEENADGKDGRDTAGGVLTTGGAGKDLVLVTGSWFQYNELAEGR